MHTANRFAKKAAPALARLRELVAGALIEGIRVPREKVVAHPHEDHAVLRSTRILETGK